MTVGAPARPRSWTASDRPPHPATVRLRSSVIEGRYRRCRPAAGCFRPRIRPPRRPMVAFVGRQPTGYGSRWRSSSLETVSVPNGIVNRTHLSGGGTHRRWLGRPCQIHGDQSLGCLLYEFGVAPGVTDMEPCLYGFDQIGDDGSVCPGPDDRVGNGGSHHAVGDLDRLSRPAGTIDPTMYPRRPGTCSMPWTNSSRSRSATRSSPARYRSSFQSKCRYTMRRGIPASGGPASLRVGGKPPPAA